LTYRAPLDDILFALRLAAGDGAFASGGLYPDLADGLAEATLTEAAKFAENVLHPLDRVGDKNPARFENGAVVTPPGWQDAYRQWIDGGWNALTAAPDHGGMGLPLLLGAACTEIWNAANMAFALCPLLGHSAIDALERHASAALRDAYLAKVVSGEWTATMNLTEPQAGSDLALLRTRAERRGDGSYRLFGQKIFITYGEHDLAGNIVHLVLARLPDAPAGTKGISLFLAPKFLPDESGAFTRRNDLRCAGIEHKLGIHGSPTCTMSYGDGEGAVAFLIGEENKGLACMFAMMNDARLAVALQGVGSAERALQAALAYARERKQGRGAHGVAAIIEHPDVARMAMTIAASTAAARAICYETAASTDAARRRDDAVAGERASLLTPIAKAYATDAGNEAASLAVQIFGGMGFIEETGAAQIFRDARITPIYEGANGIQAIDLVTRKIGLSSGAAVRREIDDMRFILRAAAEQKHLFVEAQEAVDALAAATAFMLKSLEGAPQKALAGATPYLRLFALARGGTLLIEGALVAARDRDPSAARRQALAEFYVDHLMVAAPGLARSVESAASVSAVTLC